MTKRALITGGAGFIGSHLADELLEHGFQVRVLDSLQPQVHGPERQRPKYLSRDVELVVGDVRDRDAVRRALKGCDVVCHFAALVGVGQSMYRVADYTAVNNGGTAVLWEALIEHPVERLLVASSMSVYGEGLYQTAEDRICEQVRRSKAQLDRGQWEPELPAAGPLRVVPTPESKRPDLQSVYALSKYDQERMCLLLGNAYGIATTAMRFFNVFGTRQALSNPYTGVLAIFASRLLNDRPPVIFEDGKQQRDFVHVKDVCQACRLALATPQAAGRVYNVGSGGSYTIAEVAQRMASVLGRRIEPEVSGKYRVGDVRHCIADVRLARREIKYEPQLTFEAGLVELAGWLQTELAVDRVEQMRQELETRGLAR